MKPPKTLIKIGLVLLIIATVVLAIRAIFNYTEGRKLVRALAELKDQGIPVSAKDLASPCPDEDNAARLWKAAENLLVIKDKDKGILSRAFLDLVAPKPMDPLHRGALARMIARNEKALQLLHEMADMPCFLYRDPEDPLIGTRIFDAIKMMMATRLLGFDALLRADQGDVQAAVDGIRSGLRFTPKVAQEGALVTHLVAVADTRMLAYFLGAICREKKINDDTLLQLMVELEPKPWRERLAQAIKGECVFYIEVGTHAARGTRKEIAYLFGEPSYLNDIRTWLVRPFVKADIRKTLPRFLELEAQAQLPYYKSRDFLRAQTQRSQKLPWYSFVSKFTLGNFESAFLKRAQLEAALLISRTGLACKLYKNRTGEYPNSLEALVPGVLKEIPIDPFTGKPLVYRREGEGFIVYSLGSNEKDDDGRSTYMITQMVMEKDDDWTWRESK